MTIKNLKKFAIIGVFLLFLCGLAGCGNSQELPESNGDFQAITVADKSIQKIDSLIEEYHDNYAVYYQVDEYNDLLENISGSYVGIGVYIYENEENGRVTVMSAMKGGPAYEAGFQPGDEILEVNGDDVSAQTSDYVSGKFKSAEIGTVFDVLINRPGTGEMHINVEVKDVEYPTVDSKMLEGYEDIGLIKISSFNMLTGDQFAKQFSEMQEQGMKGLILDLRDNGGGEITSALKVADMFTEKDANLMYMVTSDGTYSYYGEEDPVDIPLVILQNGNTASASEILLGALQDNQVGVTMGTLSFGKGIVQNIIPLDSGAGLRYTSARYLTAAGHEVHKIGITPDIVYEQPEGVDIYASYLMDPEEDPQLAAAVEELEKIMQ
jgi:carboxyl-terminal processing protease